MYLKFFILWSFVYEKEITQAERWGYRSIRRTMEAEGGLQILFLPKITVCSPQPIILELQRIESMISNTITSESV